MSYTEIYKFKKNGEAEFLDETKIAFRGAMMVWMKLEEKYLPSLSPPLWASTEEEKSRYHSRTSKMMFGNEGPHPMQPIWDLGRDEKVDKHERIVMLTTFDNVLARKEDLPQIIEAFNSLDFESTLPEQAEILKTVLDDDDCIAIGWNQTSVCGDTWINYGGYDEENDEEIPYNINTGERHWFIFDEEEVEQDA